MPDLEVQPWRSLFLPDGEATQGLGQSLGQSLPAGSVILLVGDLGSGKTTLVQGLGAALGITDPIVSPTFALIHEYPEGHPPLYHIDLYRLQPPEVESLHLETYWQGLEVPPGLVAIEWPDRLLTKPDRYLQIQLAHQGKGRQATLASVGDLNLDTLAAALATRGWIQDN